MIPNLLARRSPGVTKEIPMADDVEMTSDEFANATQPFADWKDIM